MNQRALTDQALLPQGLGCGAEAFLAAAPTLPPPVGLALEGEGGGEAFSTFTGGEEEEEEEEEEAPLAALEEWAEEPSRLPPPPPPPPPPQQQYSVQHTMVQFCPNKWSYSCEWVLPCPFVIGRVEATRHW